MGKCKPRIRSLNHVFPPKRIALDKCNVLGIQERWECQTISFWSTHSLKILVIWTWSLLRESVVAAEKLMHVFPARAKASLVCNVSFPKAPAPRRKVSAQFDISSRMVLNKSYQKHSLSYHQGLAESFPTKLLWKEIGIKRNLDVQHGFALLPKESSSISRVKEAWRCGFVMLCARRRFAFGMILPEEHIWQLVLATAPADWSWGLVLGTGPGDWFSWQSAKSVFAWILLCIYTFKKQPNSTQEWTKCPLFAGFSLTYCTFS